MSTRVVVLGLSVCLWASACGSDGDTMGDGTRGTRSPGPAGMVMGEGNDMMVSEPEPMETSMDDNPDADENESGGGDEDANGSEPRADASDPDMPPVLALDDACNGACEAEARCNPDVNVARCTDSCIQAGGLLGERCEALLAAESACISKQSCDSLDLYREDREAHPECADEFADVMSECAIYDGEIPEECTAFCQAANDCGADVLPPKSCAQNCLLTLTGLDASGGADCADVQRRGFGCIAEQSCAQIEDTLATGATPDACLELDAELRTACL